jgi:predicted flap endonuclease-1-like 5' DNA nuclease
MMYLIGQLAIPLLVTTAFMAMFGWALAAQFAAPREEKAQRERDGLLRDLIRFSGDGAGEQAPDLDGAPTQRLLEIKDGRIAELERALETARARNDELSGELAELGRRGQLNDPDAEELARLRAAEQERVRTVDAEVENVEDETITLQTWRLRYFEQRVKYLEGRAAATLAEPSAPAPLLGAAAEAAAEAATQQAWAAREANARAAFLEDELRAARSTPAPVVALETDPEPFAADADVDMLLRWRLLYLERRVAHLQGQAAVVEPATPALSFAADPDRWRWRAHYLEARVRHLEQRPAQNQAALVTGRQALTDEPAEPPPRPVIPSRRAKPPVLASARNGAPDDLTLIDSVSLLQQTTLYALGIFHFDQIAAWSEENVAWVDQYLRLQGRIGDEEWLEQAADLAREGPAAARRALQDEDA